MEKNTYQLATWNDLYSMGYRLPKKADVTSKECITYGDLETINHQTNLQYKTNNSLVARSYPNSIPLVPYTEDSTIQGTLHSKQVRLDVPRNGFITGKKLPFYIFSLTSSKSSTINLNVPLKLNISIAGVSSDYGSSSKLQFIPFIYYGDTWENAVYIGEGSSIEVRCRNATDVLITLRASCNISLPSSAVEGQMYYVAIYYTGLDISDLSLDSTQNSKLRYINITFTESVGTDKLTFYSKEKCVPWHVIPGASGQTVNPVQTSGKQSGTGVTIELGIWESVTGSTKADEITVTYRYKTNGTWHNIVIYQDYDIGDGSTVSGSATKEVNFPLNIKPSGVLLDDIEADCVQFYCAEAGSKHPWYYRTSKYIEGGGYTTLDWQTIPGGNSKTGLIELGATEGYAAFIRNTKAVHFKIGS